MTDYNYILLRGEISLVLENGALEFVTDVDGDTISSCDEWGRDIAQIAAKNFASQINTDIDPALLDEIRAIRSCLYLDEVETLLGQRLECKT